MYIHQKQSVKYAIIVIQYGFHLVFIPEIVQASLVVVVVFAFFTAELLVPATILYALSTGKTKCRFVVILIHDSDFFMDKYDNSRGICQYPEADSLRYLLILRKMLSVYFFLPCYVLNKLIT